MQDGRWSWERYNGCPDLGEYSGFGITPLLDADAMMKYLVYSDQWIGHDNLETIALKKAWASSHCFGGTMIWSIDLYSGSCSGNSPDGGGSGETEPDGSAIVYVDPSIWTDITRPVIQCEPPRVFVLPPYALSEPTTISFPPYVTSLDVAWSESTGWTSIVQTTTLTIPAVTTTLIDVWEFTVSGFNSATTVTSTFYPTSSVLPPLFTIIDDPNPVGQSGVTHPAVTRTITPPPYPYSVTGQPETTATTTTTSSSGIAAAIFPVVTFHPGTLGPICKTGCGTPCLIFCHAPCLLDCTDGGDDFADPINPDPPARPTPNPVVTDEPDHTAGLTVETPSPEPSDPAETEPGDEEEEDEDEQCAYEFGLAAPSYVDPSAGATGTQTVSTAQPTPTPAPVPNPEPPSPDPATETLKCYNNGAMTGRGSMIDAVTDFCTQNDGTVLDASDAGAQHTLNYTDHNAGTCFGDAGCTEALLLTVTVTNGCRFTMDRPDTDQNCGRIFREAIDKCDTSSTKYKQGGTITSNCAVWRIDPNNWWG